MSYWTVVQTASSREEVAAEGLRRAGFETYLPITAVRDREVPLFPCYLFAQVVDCWTPMASVIGVVRVLRDGDNPAHLPDRVVVDLHAREINGVVRLPSLRRGQTVRLVRGPFRGHLAIYEGMSGRERERVLLTMLGQQVRTVIRVGDAVGAH